MRCGITQQSVTEIAKVKACLAGIMPEDRAETLMQAIDALHQAPDAAAALKLY